MARPLQESLLKGVLARSQTLRVAPRAQTLLRQMAEKVTGVEGRIPRGEHVEIEDVQMLVVQNDLADQIRQSDGQIELVDECGEQLGIVRRPPSEKEIESAKARVGNAEPKLTIDELIAKIETL